MSVTGHGPPELGAYVDAGEPGIWPSCVLAIRPPAYLAAVLGMSGSKRDAKSSAEVLGVS